MNWDFQREEREFDVIPVGTHRVRIENVDKGTSQNGNDMLTIELAVSNYSSHLWYYVVFLPDRPEITNRNLTQIFDSFGIKEGDFNIKNWVGKVGACVTKMEEYNGEERAKVNYFINKGKQTDLPPYVDKSQSQLKTGKEPRLIPANDNDDDGFPF